MQISRIKVTGLFNIFNHTIEIKTSSNMTILLGQNGLGKTAILTILNYLFSYQFDKLSSFPYKEFAVVFSDKSVLTLTPVLNDETGGIETLLSYKKRDFEDRIQSGELLKNRNKVAHGIYYNTQDRYRRRSEIWLDTVTGAALSTEDFIEKNIDLIAISDGIDRHGCPAWLSKIIGSNPVYLIETKRLQTILTHRMGLGRETVDVQESINECALDFMKRLTETKAHAASIASELDRSYPRRLINVLENHPNDKLEQIAQKQTVLQNVVNNLRAVEKKRRKLVSVGLMDSARDETFSSISDSFSDDVINVLNIYLEDSNKKVDAYMDMADKVLLFLELINGHFIKKQLTATKEGLVLKSTVNKENIPLAKLSSGEQHLFILYYSMLFKCPDSVLILMDEPEISLNIAWQKSLVDDLLKIMELSHISVLMATHSPSIVRNYWDLTCELSAD